MGLPSGTLWYSCNVGTVKPQGYGTYFAWGETKPKADYSWDTYAYGTTSTTFTKYCNNASYGLSGFTDNLIILEPNDDAATSHIGNDAHMPTHTEWQELIDNCSGEWTKYRGVNGYMFTSNSNGNRLFLPAAGDRLGTELDEVGMTCYYWYSSLDESTPNRAWRIYFNSSSQEVTYSNRFDGFSVRAVKTPNYQEWVDLGLPSGTKWYSCNVGVTTPWEYGDYFAWGETTTKDYYDWSTYAYGTGENALTKYCNNADNGLNGFTDGLTTLESTDNAATTILGSGARTPTQAEWQELVDNTTSEWTTMDGVYGRKFTASNGKSIFLPAAGNRFGSEF